MGAERCSGIWRSQNLTVPGFKYPDGKIRIQNKPITGAIYGQLNNLVDEGKSSTVEPEKEVRLVTNVDMKPSEEPAAD